MAKVSPVYQNDTPAQIIARFIHATIVGRRAAAGLPHSVLDLAIVRRFAMNAPRFAVAAAALACSLPPFAAAQEQPPPYLDNRSDAAELVRSLYNAISRGEYGRAWDYFGDEKPAKDFSAFAEGYAGTARVEVETGAVSEEGAAGSIVLFGSDRDQGGRKGWQRNHLRRLLHGKARQSAGAVDAVRAAAPGNWRAEARRGRACGSFAGELR